MTSAAIPVEIRQFVLEHIHSIAEMEALMMMVKDPQTAWDADLAARKLYISPAEALAVLQRLAEGGLAVYRGGCYHNNLDNSPDGRTAEALAALYSVQLIAVTHLIHSQRRSRVQEFADAFRLRRRD